MATTQSAPSIEFLNIPTTIEEVDAPFLAIFALSMAVGALSLAYVWNAFVAARCKKLLPLDDFVEIPLIRKDVLSHDTARFTFGLPEQHVLGLPTGQHMQLKFVDADGKAVMRSYTPVTDNHSVGEVSLVVKVYKPCEKFPQGGKMSQHLDQLKIGDKILIKGPKGHTEYTGRGHFTVKPLGKPMEQRSANQFCMMAGGTGITPMLQILHAIFRDPTDTSTRVRLLYANQTEDDVLVRAELEQLQADFPDRFRLWYTLDRPPTASSWKYDTGFINKAMIERHLLFETKAGTQFFMCGPPPMIKFACQPALQELGYTEKDWVVF